MMSLLVLIQHAAARLPRLGARVALAWIAGFAALHAATAAGADPRDLPPPFF